MKTAYDSLDDGAHAHAARADMHSIPVGNFIRQYQSQSL